MTRNFKVFGLALTAALALGAVAASTSSAWFAWEEEKEPNPPVATAKAVGTQFFHTKEQQVTCEGVSFDEGKVFGGSITGVPTYSGCKLAGSGLTVHIEFTNCEYVFHTKPEGEISCDSGVEAHIKVTFLGMKLNCLTIPGQQPTSPVVDFINQGTGSNRDIRVLSKLTGIEYTKQGFCGEGTADDGSYTGEITVTGETPKGTPIGIEWQEN